MSLQCAISGEPLTSENASEIAVTPSGHICLKRLILAKLSENGGVDPFSDSGRPLSEDDLVSLQTSKNRPNMPPPPSTVSSFSGTLQQLAREYDAVVLELFDTRKALQERRRELSQALYQNDAAIRVLARVSLERDAARQRAEQFQDVEAPSKKKPRLDDDDVDANLPLSNDLPSVDLDAMLGEWEKLHKARRAKPKTSYALPAQWTVGQSKSWHKSTCRGLTAGAHSHQWLATAGKDKTIDVYNADSEVVEATYSLISVAATSVDVMSKSDPTQGVLLVAACDQELRLYDTALPDAESGIPLGDAIVHVSGHPTGTHCCAATKAGRVLVFRIPAADIQKVRHIATFTAADETAEYTCGAIHPDGLLFAVGTANGQIHLWDLKNKQVGGILSTATEDRTVAIAFSSNGYHCASAHVSGAVRVWDMRKNKMLAELNAAGDDQLPEVQSLAFHPHGKHLAYAGKSGVRITTVKEWKVSGTMDANDVVGIVWNPTWIISISGSERAVSFHVEAK